MVAAFGRRQDLSGEACKSTARGPINLVVERISARHIGMLRAYAAAEIKAARFGKGEAGRKAAFAPGFAFAPSAETRIEGRLECPS
jgi:hypothetical protein